MSETLKLCESCGEPFRWDAEVIIVNDEFYHKSCVTIYSSGYYAMIDGEILGETENEDGSEAYDILNEGEYLDGEDGE